VEVNANDPGDNIRKQFADIVPLFVLPRINICAGTTAESGRFGGRQGDRAAETRREWHLEVMEAMEAVEVMRAMEVMGAMEAMEDVEFMEAMGAVEAM
jgi:hypothetical protein